MIRILCILICICNTFFTEAQTFAAKKYPVLAYLFNSKNPISSIKQTENLNLFSIKLDNWKAKFNIIKNEDGLFVLIDGTGQIYKATSSDENNIYFNRIDSSRYIGYNFESIKFSHNQIIYAFGGYGFWNRNGQLIHFTNNGEWVVNKINKTYKTMNTFYYYSINEAKIYYIEFPWNEETTSVENIKTNLIEFDIVNKQNKLLGELNPQINFNYRYFTMDIPSLKGALNLSNNEIFLSIFSTNKVYKLINQKIKDALISKADSEIQMTFEDNGKVYYSFINDPTLRSFSISMNDFKEEPYSLYIPATTQQYTWILIIALCLIVLAIIILIYKKGKKNQNPPVFTEKEESYTVDLNSNEFNTIETSLINKLIEQSNKDNYLTVAELNSFLGIKKKTIEIQKRVRTEAINRINHKFNVNFNVETTFIERTRSEEDRRYFNYIINKEHSRIYLKRLK